jgi:twinkle protein
MEESSFVGKEPCPECGSKDNLARYDDGHGHCFGCDYYESPDGSSTKTKASHKDKNLPELGEFKALPKRKLREETLRKLRYSQGKFSGKPAHLVYIPDAETGEICSVKVRMPNKDFRFVGDTKKAGLVFQDIWPAGCAKRLVITEGELDAAAVCQANGLKYPAVSLVNGASGAEKNISRVIKYVNSFDEVIIMFDNDEVGKEAAKKVAKLIGSKAKIAELPLKDACDMLLAGRTDEIVRAVFNAQPYRPEGIVSLESLREEVLAPIEKGESWDWEPLTDYTYGRRLGEVIVLGAGSGVGKTQFITQQACADIASGHAISVFFLEQPAKETAKRMCGQWVGKQFHIPDSGHTTEEIEESFDSLIKTGKCFLFNHFGAKDWDAIKSNIRWLAITENVKYFYLDNLTALVADAQDKQNELERIMSEMAGLAQELNINILVISHLATPEKGAHEEGARVMAKHLKGSRAIAFWAHFILALERNTQADDEESRNVTTVRILKDRYTGRGTGKTFHLMYDNDSGKMVECEAPKREPDGSSFEKEDF